MERGGGQNGTGVGRGGGFGTERRCEDLGDDLPVHKKVGYRYAYRLGSFTLPIASLLK